MLQPMCTIMKLATSCTVSLGHVKWNLYTFRTHQVFMVLVREDDVVTHNAPAVGKCIGIVQVH